MLVAKLKVRKIYTNVFELSVDDIGAGDRMSGEERQKFYFFMFALNYGLGLP